MKIAIKPYLSSLLKENSVYIALCSFLIIMAVIFIPINFQKLNSNNDKITVLTKDTNDLNNKINTLNSIQLTQEELDADVKLFNTLIPNSEDYFSIIYTLDKLSRGTGFLITSYSIDLKNTTKDRLKLTITGSGNKDSFLQFLKVYNFGGGRLMTSDKIELSQLFSGQLKINVTFYNTDVALDANKSVTFLPSFANDLSKLKNKIGYNLKVGSDEAQLNLSYPRKLNPF